MTFSTSSDREREPVEQLVFFGPDFCQELVLVFQRQFLFPELDLDLFLLLIEIEKHAIDDGLDSHEFLAIRVEKIGRDLRLDEFRQVILDEREDLREHEEMHARDRVVVYVGPAPRARLVRDQAYGLAVRTNATSLGLTEVQAIQATTFHEIDRQAFHDVTRVVFSRQDETRAFHEPGKPGHQLDYLLDGYIVRGRGRLHVSM